MISEKIQKKIYKGILAVITAAMFLICIIVFFSPIITINDFKLSPFDLAMSRDILDINWGDLELLKLSYTIYKYFYLGFAGALTLLAFLALYALIFSSEHLSRSINSVLCCIVVLLFVSMLISFNYINAFNVPNGANIPVKTTSAGSFAAAGAIYIIKFLVDAIFNKITVKEELKRSNVTFLLAFAQTFLVLIALLCPFYIFPGSPHRMHGMDIIIGTFDPLSGLQMSYAYKFIILFSVGAVVVSFIIALSLFITKRKAYVQYFRFHNVIALLAIVTYALMGLNYMIIYVDTKAYLTMFASKSMNTYSYLPLVLLVLFWLGSRITEIAINKLNVEYKIVAQHSDVLINNANGIEQGLNSVAPVNAPLNAEDGIILDPIPAFSELDKKAAEFEQNYQQRRKNVFDNLTLPRLVNHVIEYAKHSPERLSYGEVEMKTFISGLAASKLSILQGMSGTGKTSLPKIFMEAIDGVCDLVAIESSWRDRNELLGYYNEFSKKYTPKSFTQFLYTASLNKDIPYFIVLDEMNLSRIEYYFSNFLSLMESRESARFIKLFDVQLFPRIDERDKYLGLRDGHTIDVPRNVWFIGTANRDESTFEISDKVYDRAQTMNFDKRAPKVSVKEQVNYPKKFVPYAELRKLFDQTKTVGFDAEKYDAIKKAEKLLAPYRVSFGNRVLKQIEEFVNAYVACSEGGLEGRDKYVLEAVDCIVLSKVVRKLEFKQLNDVDPLIDGFSAIKLTRCVEFIKSLTDSI